MLIVEMEIPKGCYFCPMAEPHPAYWFCRAFDDTTQIDGCAPMDKRRSWCPIKGVLPDEHGDLIDRDVAVKTFKHIEVAPYSGFDGQEAFYTPEDVVNTLLCQDVVIAAERSEHGTTAD